MVQSAENIKKIGIIGGGAWGTALACIAARAGHKTRLWVREAELVETLNTQHENTLYLPAIALPETIQATNQLADMADCEAILLATPAQHLDELLAQAIDHIAETSPIILCAKGIERGTLRLMPEIAATYLPQERIAVLSGPSFAADTANGLPTAVTLACGDMDIGQKLAHALTLPSFRIYLSDDIIGASIGGAVKNVLAIACGIVHGRKLGQSARAALTARGFAEMTRLGRALGAKTETLAGLCGLGDLILTCASTQSRNFSLGVALGHGKITTEILASRKSVSEGALTAQALYALASKHKVEMPICFAVASIIDERADIDAVIMQLLARPVTGKG